MLAIARQRAADLGRDVDLREGDAEHLPFPDGSFDTVVCALSLCSIPDPAAPTQSQLAAPAPTDTSRTPIIRTGQTARKARLTFPQARPFMILRARRDSNP
ncbi:class I SAM-dependent methyltransferase [Micromonospora sp. NPDC049891]|uniref:class I SAM-dependent methyltransferase n=1 Tax=Micromonospora sp. NPDC049891 TaxID=3155655 RepID=UPI0033CBD4F2